MRVRLGWILAGLLLAAVAGASFVASRPATQAGTMAGAAPMVDSPVQQSGSVIRNAGEASRQPVVNSGPQGLTVPTKTLSAEFATATDYRRFALAAAQHPERGGISYAANAIGICQVLETILPAYGIGETESIAYSEKEDSLAFAARAKSLETARRNCGQFSKAELSSAEGQRYLDLAKSQQDIIAAMKDRFTAASKSSDQQVRSSSIAEILSAKDPLLLSYTLQRMMLDRNGNGQLGYWLDGQFTSNADSDAIEAAIKAIPCKYGLACDGSDFEVMRACLGGNGCFESRYDYLKSALSPANQAKFESLQKRLAEIVDNVDVAAITRRK